MTAKKADRTAGGRVHANVLEALARPNCDASAALVQRTRRSMREMAIGMEEKRIRQRRNTGFAVSVLFFILILFSPVVWSGVEDVVAGEHFTDLSLQIAFLLLMLAPALFAVLFAVWKEQRDQHRHRRGF